MPNQADQQAALRVTAEDIKANITDAECDVVKLRYDKEGSAPILERMKRLSKDFPRFGELYRDLIKNCPSEAFTLEGTDVCTDGTNYLWLRLKPTDRLLGLMAAFGAGEVE